MQLVNKTGRDLVIFADNPATNPLAQTVTLPADGPAIQWVGPRAPSNTLDVEGVAIPISRSPAPAPGALGTCELPPPVDGVTYIASYPVEVYAWLTGRTDFVRMGPAVFQGGVQTGAIGFARS